MSGRKVFGSTLLSLGILGGALGWYFYRQWQFAEQQRTTRGAEAKAEKAAELPAYQLSVEMDGTVKRIYAETEGVRTFFSDDIQAFEKALKAGRNALYDQRYVTATNLLGQAKAQADALYLRVDARKADWKAAEERRLAEEERLVEEKKARERAEFQQLRRSVDVLRSKLYEAGGKIAPYRGDSVGFTVHLAEVDWVEKSVADAADPLDAVTAKVMVERLQKAVNAVESELKWLETNKPMRERARAIDHELRGIEPELARVKAAACVPTRLAEGRRLQTEAQQLLARGAFKSAAEKFCVAKTKFQETVKAAKAFQLNFALDEARAYAVERQWEQSLAAAQRALEWDAASEDGQKLKEQAESCLGSSLRLVVRVEGREVDGAQVTVDGTDYTSPVTLKKLEKGACIATLSAVYEAGGRRYQKTFAAIDVDWTGPKIQVLTLPEVREPQAGDAKEIELPGGVRMRFVWCPPGTFTMGSPAGIRSGFFSVKGAENGRSGDEVQHRVTLTKGFWLGQYEVTQAQWRSVMGNNPSYFKGDDNPVEQVSWEDCQKFIAKCNAAAKGVRFALPTEAEWEYACRAGTTGPYAGTGNLDEMGWYHSNIWFDTSPVGQKKPNAWNLYDMHGNVYEWCADWYGAYDGDYTDPTGPASGEYRVLRGGGWGTIFCYCRSANRYKKVPRCRSEGIGFRLLCSAGSHGE